MMGMLRFVMEISRCRRRGGRYESTSIDYLLHILFSPTLHLPLVLAVRKESFMRMLHVCIFRLDSMRGFVLEFCSPST